MTKLAQEFRRAGHTTKSWTTQDGKHRAGKPIDKGVIYRILDNRVYLGEAVHKGTRYPGEHAAIIDRGTWDKVQAVLAENTVARANATRAQTPALLRGLIFAPGGHAMTPSHTRKAGKLYRYYVASDAIRQGYAECPVRSVPAAEVEQAAVALARPMYARRPTVDPRRTAPAGGRLLRFGAGRCAPDIPRSPGGWRRWRRSIGKACRFFSCAIASLHDRRARRSAL